MKFCQNLNVPAVWLKTGVSIVIVAIVSIIIFFDSWASMVEIWSNTRTFNHGFFIVPISIWLIWIKKENYKSLTPEMDLRFLSLVLFSGFIWLISDLINVQVGKQFSTVSILVSSLLLVLGTHVFLKMLFPLLFLFLMVPMGEELIPYLMEFTATFTVNLIRLTGMSVYREGLYFSLTSGNWSVVEACSGINYLVASITLGLVYAYISFYKTWKRVLFILLSIIIPILANGLRAYFIVMIGHFSNMTLAVGVDHILYGAAFFGVVMLILFYIGSFWKDETDSQSKAIESNSGPILIADENNAGFSLISGQHGLLLTVLLVFYSIWPLSSSWLQLKQGNNNSLSYDFSRIEKQGWKKISDPDWKWQASFKNVKEDKVQYLENNGQTIAIYQAHFGNESQGSGELVNSQNLIVSPNNKDWKIIGVTATELIKSSGSKVIVEEAKLTGNSTDLLTFRWYRVGSEYTESDYMAKLLQLRKRLLLDVMPEYSEVILMEVTNNQFDIAREGLKKVAVQWLEK